MLNSNNLRVILVGIFFAFTNVNAALPEDLFSRVHYSCSDRSVFMGGVEGWDKAPNYLENMKKYFETSITEGLTRLEKINKDLAERAVHALQSSDLVISCKRGKGTPVATFEKRRFHKATISMGSSAWEVYSLVLKNVEINSALIQKMASDTKDVFNLGVLMHEFMHFSRFDNLPTKKHNDLKKYGLKVSDDIVYACEEAVFPGSTGDWISSEIERIETKKACSGFKYLDLAI